MGLEGREIVVCVTGSIAAYKAAELVSDLTKRKARVSVVMTKGAQQFVAPLTFETLSHNHVVTDSFEREVFFYPTHTSLAERANLVVVAPATANILGKIAHGIADDPVSTFLLAATCPILHAPAMNENMWKNAIVQENVAKLRRLGHRFVDPEEGPLACGIVGCGRLAATPAILAAIESLLA
ncbi:MAG: flavoprotein [Planctomycetota bacterium]